MTPDAHRIAGKMNRLDAGQFRLPRHGLERYEFHACRCDVCTAAHDRVERLALRLDNELRRMWGTG